MLDNAKLTGQTVQTYMLLRDLRYRVLELFFSSENISSPSLALCGENCFLCLLMQLSLHQASVSVGET